MKRVLLKSCVKIRFYKDLDLFQFNLDTSERMIYNFLQLCFKNVHNKLECLSLICLSRLF
jgi:hypothetical protein